MGSIASRRSGIGAPLAAALILAAAGSAQAAKPVARVSRRVRAEPYDEAATKAGLRLWGRMEQPGPVLRATLRLQGGRAIFTVALPPATPQPRADGWFGGLADAMGWGSASLSSNPQPGALFMRADVGEVGRSTGFARIRSRVDLPALRRSLRGIVPGPVLLAVRVSGAELYSITPEPAARVRDGTESFLFYRLDGAPGASGALDLEYGLPPRWIAAVGSGLLLWLLFPFVALYAVREHLKKQGPTEPKERLRAYRRWQRGIMVVQPIGAFGAFFAIGIGRGVFLGGTSSAAILPLLFLLPTAIVGLAARLIGLPLERETWPLPNERPWYRIVGPHLVTLVLMFALPAFLILGVFNQTGGGSPTASLMNLQRLLPLVLLVPMALIAVPLAVTALQRRRQRTAEGPLPDEVPEPLAGTVRAFCERLGCPIRRVIFMKGGVEAPSTAVLVAQDLAFVSRDLPALFDEEQVAGLVAAAALAQPRTRLDRLLSYTWVVSLLPVLVLLVTLPRLTTARGGAGPLMLMLPAMLVVTGLMSVVGRRSARRQQEADLTAAEAMSSPRRLVVALAQIEELQLLALGLSQGSPAASRSERLRRKLGLD